MKKILLLMTLVCAIHIANAQRFTHGVGFGVFVIDAPSTDLGAFGTVTYSPKYNFYETEALSVSVGVPLNVGFAQSYVVDYSGYYYEPAPLRFMINAPMMINLNVGAGSTKQNEKRFGFFVGGGFGLHYGDYGLTRVEGNYEYYDTQYGATFGPSANAGFRIAVGKHQKNIETYFTYGKGVTNQKTAFYGMGALFNF
jgi:hypothetical protein